MLGAIAMFERLFQIRAKNSNVRTGMFAGITTLGFVSCGALMLVSGNWKKAHWLMYVIGALFVYHLITVSKLGA
jgi:xanthine/uracil/vitamin C permease (AzgA family)